MLEIPSLPGNCSKCSPLIFPLCVKQKYKCTHSKKCKYYTERSKIISTYPFSHTTANLMFSKSSNSHMSNSQTKVNLGVSLSENYFQAFGMVLIVSYITSVTEESHAVFFSKKKKKTKSLKQHAHTVQRQQSPDSIAESIGSNHGSRESLVSSPWLSRKD